MTQKRFVKKYAIWRGRNFLKSPQMIGAAKVQAAPMTTLVTGCIERVPGQILIEEELEALGARSLWHNVRGDYHIYFCKLCARPVSLDGHACGDQFPPPCACGESGWESRGEGDR